MKSEGSVSGKRSVLLSHPLNEECWRAGYTMKKITSNASARRQIACILQKKLQDLFRMWRSRFRSIPLTLTHSHNSYSFFYNHLNYHSISSFSLTAKLRFGAPDFYGNRMSPANRDVCKALAAYPEEKTISCQEILIEFYNFRSRMGTTCPPIARFSVHFPSLNACRSSGDACCLCYFFAKNCPKDLTKSYKWLFIYIIFYIKDCIYKEPSI